MSSVIQGDWLVTDGFPADTFEVKSTAGGDFFISDLYWPDGIEEQGGHCQVHRNKTMCSIDRC